MGVNGVETDKLHRKRFSLSFQDLTRYLKGIESTLL